MRLLVVEDEVRLRETLSEGLSGLGYSVEGAGDGVSALIAARAGDFHAILLDIGLPGPLDGFETARQLRDESNRTPIVTLTARTTKADVVLGLDCGADDYVTKPFDLDELNARLRALIRRAGRVAANQRVGRVELDPIASTATFDGERIALTRTETRLLSALMERGPRTASRKELRKEVWGLGFDPGTRLVDVHVSNLRRKLEAGGRRRVIQTVRGAGFVLSDPGLA